MKEKTNIFIKEIMRKDTFKFILSLALIVDFIALLICLSYEVFEPTYQEIFKNTSYELTRSNIFFFVLFDIIVISTVVFYLIKGIMMIKLSSWKDCMRDREHHTEYVITMVLSFVFAYCLKTMFIVFDGKSGFETAPYNYLSLLYTITAIITILAGLVIYLLSVVIMDFLREKYKEKNSLVFEKKKSFTLEEEKVTKKYEEFEIKEKENVKNIKEELIIVTKALWEFTGNRSFYREKNKMEVSISKLCNRLRDLEKKKQVEFLEEIEFLIEKVYVLTEILEEYQLLQKGSQEEVEESIVELTEQLFQETLEAIDYCDRDTINNIQEKISTMKS